MRSSVEFLGRVTAAYVQGACPKAAVPWATHGDSSSGTVRHGYEKQLEIYLDASRANHGIFVVMDFGDLGQKLEQITAIQAERRAAGQRASDIVVIDATKKASASKRH